MITITMPSWIFWMFAVMTVLGIIEYVGTLYLRFLQRQTIILITRTMATLRELEQKEIEK